MIDKIIESWITLKNKMEGNDEEFDADPDDDHDEYVAEPEAVRRRILDALGQHKAVAEAYRKIIKASRFEDAARNEIRNSIELLKQKWGRVQGALKRKEL